MILVLGLFLPTGCEKTDNNLGTIQGSMIVSENCINENCPIADYSDIYASRRLAIYSGEENNLITYVRISDDGTYQVTLPQGDYILDLINDHFDISYDLPKNVKVEANKVKNIDVSIAIDRNDQP